MKPYLEHHPWQIIETGFHPENNRISESIFSIGNGRFGQRANFEEGYSGSTLPGNYVAGVYYPDKTRVGWWKNGYPEYFAKVLNAANWIGVDILIDGEKLDLATATVLDFKRVLDMQGGVLERSCTLRLVSGKELEYQTIRFCSLADDETAAICLRIKPLNFSGPISLTPFINGDVENEDANYDEKFWNRISEWVDGQSGGVVAETKKTAFQVATGMCAQLFLDGEPADFATYPRERELYAGCLLELPVGEGQTLELYKYTAVVSSLNHPAEKLAEACTRAYSRARDKGFEKMLAEHRASWADKWAEADIAIEGDVAAQQGIRFCIFQLCQTYTGKDERLNIGPKGFTGEKYGGSTYWDTEAYCLPFFLATAPEQVSRNLLLYRYKQLDKAIENAAKLGFDKGAALYPMVTMNGEECHNEWEITFEEIHRNGAIAYAIYDYIRYTGDTGYLAEAGLEVLIGIARFWSQRAHFSARNGQYMIHGVTGPNEYENNVNNNWYTNYIAVWCLRYALEGIEAVKRDNPGQFEAICERTSFYEFTETKVWKEIAENIYSPKDADLGVFVQHDGFLDKELIQVDQLDPAHRPLNQKWSWDRILRSCFIKQADVLQGLYFFEDHFTEDEIRRNFDFYEPMTVHESSLSPCVHVILASRLGKEEKAYELYLRTARLDLDNYNNDTDDGCHITSMAGTWMAFVKGFGGMRVREGVPEFNPYLPQGWKGYSFSVRFRGHFLQLSLDGQKARVQNLSKEPVRIRIWGQDRSIAAGATDEIIATFGKK